VRFARGEKIKMSDRKHMYTDRIKVIWKRQVAALSSQSDHLADRKTTSVSARESTETMMRMDQTTNSSLTPLKLK
jgi:hypothetical protein